jgi:auxin-responsive protein IAA
MELQLGLGLPSEKTMKGLDLNSYVSEPKGLLGSGQLQLGQYSWFSTNANDKKRSFIDAFEESSGNEDGPQTLPLLVWNNQPNDEDDFPKDLDNHSSNSCASNKYIHSLSVIK